MTGTRQHEDSTTLRVQPCRQAVVGYILRRFIAYVTDDKSLNKMRKARRHVYDPAAQQQQQQAGPCARAVSSPYCGEFLLS